jgi:hypothetical protein
MFILAKQVLNDTVGDPGRRHIRLIGFNEEAIFSFNSENSIVHGDLTPPQLGDRLEYGRNEWLKFGLAQSAIRLHFLALPIQQPTLQRFFGQRFPKPGGNHFIIRRRLTSNADCNEERGP